MKVIKKILAVTMVCVVMLTNTGCENPFIDTPSNTPDPYAIQIHTKNDLQDNCYYIKHGDEFYEIPYGEQSFYKNEETEAEYVLAQDDEPEPTRNWFYKKGKDELIIPTMYQDDSIVYKTPETINNVFEWERFSDDGYTIGLRGINLSENGKLITSNYIANLLENGPFDKVMHRVEETDNEYYQTFTIDSINGKKLSQKDLGENGCIKNLNTDTELKVQIYAGTTPYTIKTKADVRVFSNIENYWTKTIQYQSGFAEITTSKSFVSGYYKVENSGLFRYINRPYSKDIDITKIDYNKRYFKKEENGYLITKDDKDQYLYEQ